MLKYLSMIRTYLISYTSCKNALHPYKRHRDLDYCFQRCNIQLSVVKTIRNSVASVFFFHNLQFLNSTPNCVMVSTLTLIALVVCAVSVNGKVPDGVLYDVERLQVLVNKNYTCDNFDWEQAVNPRVIFFFPLVGWDVDTYKLIFVRLDDNKTLDFSERTFQFSPDCSNAKVTTASCYDLGCRDYRVPSPGIPYTTRSTGFVTFGSDLSCFSAQHDEHQHYLIRFKSKPLNANNISEYMRDVCGESYKKPINEKQRFTKYWVAKGPLGWVNGHAFFPADKTCTNRPSDAEEILYMDYMNWKGHKYTGYRVISRIDNEYTIQETRRLFPHKTCRIIRETDFNCRDVACRDKEQQGPISYIYKSDDGWEGCSRVDFVVNGTALKATTKLSLTNLSSDARKKFVDLNNVLCEPTSSKAASVIPQMPLWFTIPFVSLFAMLI